MNLVPDTCVCVRVCVYVRACLIVSDLRQGMSRIRDAVPAVRQCELANRKKHVCPDIVHCLLSTHR